MHACIYKLYTQNTTIEKQTTSISLQNTGAMELGTSGLGRLFELARSYAPAFLLTSFLAFIVLFISGPGATGPPSIRDPIPFVSNTVQFVFNNDKFMKRARYVVTLDHVSAIFCI